MSIDSARRLIESLAPRACPVPWRDALIHDEARWFLAAVEQRVIEFSNCSTGCPRLAKWGAAGPDHFTTPSGHSRHLYSNPTADVAWLNREYIPHIAAYARAVLDLGYVTMDRSFSLYRMFSRDLIHRHRGQSYETDAEFLDAEGRIALQIEAKRSAVETDRLVAAISSARHLRDLPPKAVKEIEYVLDLSPRKLWVVGPGSIDPAPYVFDVHVDGFDATFTPGELSLDR